MIILVADDDRLVRFMMKSMLNEIMTSDYIILEAANGQQMLDLCRENTPDIVFADIKMPYINGVDAIEECKKYSQDTQFVIISGCSEFEYAQKALKMGVFDYLLKPVEEDQLRLVMEKLQKKIVGNKKESNSRFQLKLFNIFNYFSTVGIGEEYEEKPSDEDIIYDVIGMKSRCSKTYQEFHMEFQKDIINNINELGKEFVKRGSYYAQIYSPEGNPYFIFCSTEGKQEEILSYVKKLGWKNKNDKVAFNFVYFNKKYKGHLF